jgi:putative tricarboxylic transport membrane protein
MERRFKLGGEFFLALGTAAFGVFLAVQTASIEVSPSYARVGPRVFPWVISFALIGLGLWIAFDVFRGSRKLIGAPASDEATAAEEPNPANEPLDWNAFLTIGLGLVLQMLLMNWAGFVIASTVLFACVARAFDSRRLTLNAAVGFMLALVVYVGFQYGLGLDLPAGILSGIL